MTEVKKISREPPLRYRAEKRSRLFSALYLRGGSREIFFTSVILQLLPSDSDEGGGGEEEDKAEVCV